MVNETSSANAAPSCIMIMAVGIAAILLLGACFIKRRSDRKRLNAAKRFEEEDLDVFEAHGGEDGDGDEGQRGVDGGGRQVA